MAHWASSADAYAEPYDSPSRQPAGTRLDQILADLKARPRPHLREPEAFDHRNVTPLNTPFRTEFQTLQASIDQLADRMDSHRLAEAIAELSDKVATLHADRSLGDAEMRLLRSIRRSLDDLIYQMSLTGSDGQHQQPATAPPIAPSNPAPEAAPVFGRRSTRPAGPRPLPGQIGVPHLEPARSMIAGLSGGKTWQGEKTWSGEKAWSGEKTWQGEKTWIGEKAWPGSQFLSRHPLASVAAAVTIALLLAQGMTQFAPKLSDITGSIRESTRSTPLPAAPTQTPHKQEYAGVYVPVPPPAPEQSFATAPAPIPVTAPPPAPAASQPAIVTAARPPAEDVRGIAAYQAGVRLADGPARDFRGAMALFEKAGDMPAAQFRLALLYERGQGAPKNPALARALYQRAAEKGHVRAMHNLGVLYADGPDGKPDYALAAEWFRRAADYGLRDSQYNLATLTARGLGVEKKPVAAYSWFSLAAAQGDADAARQRDEIGKSMDAGSLRAAKAVTEAFRAKTPDPTVNQIAVN